MKLYTYVYLCPSCQRVVRVTPTNVNRMLHVVCTGHINTAEHEPRTMRQLGISVYLP